MELYTAVKQPFDKIIEPAPNRLCGLVLFTPRYRQGSGGGGSGGYGTADKRRPDSWMGTVAGVC